MKRSVHSTRLPPAINETLGYLMVQICRAHRNRAQELLAGIGLHAGQEMLVLRLWTADGITQTELAERVWHELELMSFANLTTEERVLLRRLLLQVYDNVGQ